MNDRFDGTRFHETRANIIVTAVFVFTLIFSLLITQQIEKKRIFSSHAQITSCTTPGGCGGNCDPSKNLGCGYGGCRFWEYCADENRDGIYSCYDTTNLGKKSPDFSKACGYERANTIYPSVVIPHISPTIVPPNVKCNNPQGCGGNCNPNQNTGCGYGGCRFWEYCADENRDGIYSCYDTTDNGKRQPDFNRACGYEKTNQQNPSNVPATPTSTPRPTLSPTPTTALPTVTVTGVSLTQTGLLTITTTPTLSATSTITPTPSVTVTGTITPSPSGFATDTPTPPENPTPTSAESPTPTPELTGSLDFSKLCMPVEVNGSLADKMDVLIIPVNFTQEQRRNNLYQLAVRVKESFRHTNLSQYENEVLKKINWYVLNVEHPDFDRERARQFEGGDKDSLFAFGLDSNYCGRDRFLIIFNTDQDLVSSAIQDYGAVVFLPDVMYGNGEIIAHELGHAVGSLSDEYLSGRSDPGANCAASGTSQAENAVICAANDYDPSCIPPEENGAFKLPCPQWDCNVINCSELAKNLLKNAGCYRNCGVQNNYRASFDSIMRVTSGPDGNKYSGPALVHMIEKIFVIYK